MPEIVAFVVVKFESKTFINDDTFAIERDTFVMELDTFVIVLDKSVMDVLNASCNDFVCVPTSVVTLSH